MHVDQGKQPTKENVLVKKGGPRLFQNIHLNSSRSISITDLNENQCGIGFPSRSNLRNLVPESVSGWRFSSDALSDVTKPCASVYTCLVLKVGSRGGENIVAYHNFEGNHTHA